MKITVKLFATLREGRPPLQTLEFPEGKGVVEVIRALNIPEQEVALIFVNGRHADPEDRLKDGDTLALFPPVGGG